MPLDWNISQACAVPKPGKQTCADISKRDRLVHVLDPVGKGFYAHIVRKRQQCDSLEAPWFSTMTYGYLKHRSRDGAIGSMRILKHRLSKAHISHLIELLDLSNAFASLSHSHMDETLPHFILEEDRDLAQLRYRDVFYFVECPDGCLQLKPHCGGLQGDTFMVYMWLSGFAPLVASWQMDQIGNDCFSKLCIAKSPMGVATDTSLAVCADDLSKVLVL